MSENKNIVAQVVSQKEGIIAGLYKMIGVDGKSYGYFKFTEIGGFIYFGNSNTSRATTPNSKYLAFQKGGWSINSDAMLSIKASEPDSNVFNGVMDSLIYSASNRNCIDSIGFDISIKDNDGRPVQGTLLYLKKYADKLKQVGEDGNWSEDFKILDDKVLATWLEILPPPGYYRSKLKILKDLNYHKIIVYLKTRNPNFDQHWKDAPLILGMLS